MTSRGKEHDPGGGRSREVDLGYGLPVHPRTARGDPRTGTLLADTGSNEPFEHGG